MANRSSSNSTSSGSGSGSSRNNKGNDPPTKANITKSTTGVPWLHVTSNLFFVLASVLYLVMSVDDFRWSKELQTLPMHVRVADDDVTWVNYRKEERYNASQLLLELDSNGNGTDNENDDEVSSMVLDEDAVAAQMESLFNDDEDDKEGGGPKRMRWLQHAESNTTEMNATFASIFAPTTTTTSSDVATNTSTPEGTAAAAATSATTGAPAVTATPEELYYDFWWSELPPDIQQAYVVLGYTQDLWDSGGDPPSETLDWEELTDEQRAAATHIGYTQAIWDGEGGDVEEATLVPDNGFTESTTNATTAEGEDTPVAASSTTEAPSKETMDPQYWYDYWWNELPPHIREAWATLGYTQILWDSDGDSVYENYSWDELTPAQQEAATTVGFDRYSWDKVDPSNPNAVVASVDDDYISYDDDYVFLVGSSQTWVSRYMILYFCAAMCFVYVGVLDLIREKNLFHVLMILAGAFGVVAAMLVEKDVYLSNVFSSVSVHFFLLEALTLFGSHKRQRIDVGKTLWLRYSLSFADVLFGVGALLDVILSYFYVFDETADWDSTLIGIEVFAAVLWLLCSLVYISVTVYAHVLNEKPSNDKEIGQTAGDEDSEVEPTAARPGKPVDNGWTEPDASDPEPFNSEISDEISV